MTEAQLTYRKHSKDTQGNDNYDIEHLFLKIVDNSASDNYQQFESLLKWINLVLYLKHDQLLKKFPTDQKVEAERQVSTVLNAYPLKEAYVASAQTGNTMIYISLTQARLSIFESHRCTRPIAHVPLIATSRNVTAMDYSLLLGNAYGINKAIFDDNNENNNNTYTKLLTEILNDSNFNTLPEALLLNTIPKKPVAVISQNCKTKNQNA